MFVRVPSFHERVQLREPAFEKWLKDNAPPPPADPSSAGSGGRGVERAQEAFLQWPLLHEVECEYVDTPEKVREGRCLDRDTVGSVFVPL